MKDKATFQNKVKVLNKLFDSGCDTEKKLQQLDMEAILKIPNITIPDMGVIMELQKNTSTFGEIENKSSLAEAIMGAARNAAEDNIPDYLQDLYYATEGSFLEEVDNDIVASIYKNVVATVMIKSLSR